MASRIAKKLCTANAYAQAGEPDPRLTYFGHKTTTSLQRNSKKLTWVILTDPGSDCDDIVALAFMLKDSMEELKYDITFVVICTGGEHTSEQRIEIVRNKLCEKGTEFPEKFIVPDVSEYENLKFPEGSEINVLQIAPLNLAASVVEKLANVAELWILAGTAGTKEDGKKGGSTNWGGSPESLANMEMVCNILHGGGKTLHVVDTQLINKSSTDRSVIDLLQRELQESVLINMIQYLFSRAIAPPEFILHLICGAVADAKGCKASNQISLEAVAKELFDSLSPDEKNDLLKTGKEFAITYVGMLPTTENFPTVESYVQSLGLTLEDTIDSMAYPFALTALLGATGVPEKNSKSFTYDAIKDAIDAGMFRPIVEFFEKHGSPFPPYDLIFYFLCSRYLIGLEHILGDATITAGGSASVAT